MEPVVVDVLNVEVYVDYSLFGVYISAVQDHIDSLLYTFKEVEIEA